MILDLLVILALLIGPSIILIVIIAIAFYRNKKVFIPGYIFLGCLSGCILGGISQAVYLPRYSNPVVFFLSCIIGIVLGFMLMLPKTGSTKIIFGVLLVIFITSPIIGSFFPAIPEKTIMEKVEEEIKRNEEKTKRNLDKLRSYIAKYYKKKKFYPPDFKHKMLISKISVLYPKIYHLDSNKIWLIADYGAWG